MFDGVATGSGVIAADGFQSLPSPCWHHCPDPAHPLCSVILVRIFTLQWKSILENWQVSLFWDCGSSHFLLSCSKEIMKANLSTLNQPPVLMKRKRNGIINDA